VAVRFDNTYARLPAHFHAEVRPVPVAAPRLIAWNDELAARLGLDDLDPERRTLVFSGNGLLPGMQPIALAYAGHQFGNFVPQLGDGRAVLLGEVTSPVDGARYDLQLKGSGQTPFSRRGDGKSSLGPVIREYLLSEAMHRLGVPTTRALAAVATGEMVLRESRLPGGVLTRVASSHLRVGTFEYFAARRDVDALHTLIAYAIERHYPDAADGDRPAPALFARVAAAQARLIAHWMALGFIHGVMNTDNCAIGGHTIDYGPCAFMDRFEIDKVFSSIDHYGRYAYGQQSAIGHWNLQRLADCLMLVDEDEAAYTEVLEDYGDRFKAAYLAHMRTKLGLLTDHDDDWDLVTAWLQYLQDNGLDYTLSFRRLADRLDVELVGEFGRFERRWRERIDAQDLPRAAVRDSMNAVNPLYIPRNHQVERAIAASIGGDDSVFHELHAVLAAPYDPQPGREAYAEPPRPHEEVEMTFCGT
jgi:serine/tyrosine/threonine adenylyltransferase